MDKAILIGIQEYIRNDYLTPVMLFVSAIGSFGAVWLFMAMLMAFRRSSRGQGILLLISILFCGGVGECIKHVVMRPRPFLQIPDLMLLGPLPRSFSFPSGHTICAFALAFSRLYLGAHYPTDVLAGVVVAYLGSAFVWRMGKKIGQVINIG